MCGAQVYAAGQYVFAIGVQVLVSPATSSFAAIRKDTGLYCGSRLRKGEVFGYVGLSQNLKDLKDHSTRTPDPFSAQ